MQIKQKVHTYKATIRWSRQGSKFTDLRYTRRHEWVFDGGARVPASSSPNVVPLPFSVPEAVDPEEALVASVSSCHMLTYLYYAAKAGFVVDSYVDEPVGEMHENDAGKLAITRITLHPHISFAGDKHPTADDLRTLHHQAHSDCYIANSVRCDIVVADA